MWGTVLPENPPGDPTGGPAGGPAGDSRVVAGRGMHGNQQTGRSVGRPQASYSVPFLDSFTRSCAFFRLRYSRIKFGWCPGNKKEYPAKEKNGTECVPVPETQIGRAHV